MPFKSDAQRKLCYVLKGKGQAGSWDCAEWSEATSDKKLPEHVEDQTEKKALGITNKLKGGVGDNKNPSDLDRAELKSGIKEEKEHTNDTDVATEIAVDHLTKTPNYYSKLDKVEKKSSEIWQTGKGKTALAITALLSGGLAWLKHSLKQSKKSPITEVPNVPVEISEMPTKEKAAFFAKLAAARPGLWANIRAKKKRGEAAATPGDEDYPDSKNWSKVTAISEKKAQCWEGYERVPGTKALTSGSCRPKGKKKEDKSAAAWETSEGKNPEGGLNDKGRASLKAQGHDIKRPQPEGGARKDSFCARMGGMKAKLTSSETANDPDSRINKALRKWKCGSDMVEKQAIAALASALLRSPMVAAAAGMGGLGAYAATRPTNNLVPTQPLSNTTGAAPPTPPSKFALPPNMFGKTGWDISRLAKQAVASLTPAQAASASIGSSILNGAQPAMAGHMQTVAKTYDASTPKQMIFNGKPAGKPFYRGDLQQQPGPAAIGSINTNTGTFNQYQGANGLKPQSTSVGRFGTFAPKPIG